MGKNGEFKDENMGRQILREENKLVWECMNEREDRMSEKVLNVKENGKC